MKTKLSKDEKRILKEDIRDLKWLIEKYKTEGKHNKAADCESELNKLKKRLGGEEYGIQTN